MAIFKRIRHYIFHNLLQCGIYAAVFLALFVTFVFSTAASRQANQLKAALGNSVILYRHYPGEQLSGDYFYDGEDVDQYLDFPEVAGYNLLSLSSKYLEGCEPYIADQEAYEKREESMKTAAEYVPSEEFKIIGVTDSGRSPFFTRSGLALEEGRGLTVEDEHRKVALVSENFAKVNGLGIGDTVTMHQDNTTDLVEQYQEEWASYERPDMEIVGMFSTAIDNWTANPRENYDNVVIVPETTAKDMFPNFVPTVLMTYLNSAEDAETYMERLRRMDEEDTIREYEILWNGEVYEAVSRPVQEVSGLGNVMLAIVTAGCVVILLVLGFMNIMGHRREWGILLSLGRSGLRIALGGAMEAFIPLAAGALISVAIGAGVSGYAAPKLEAHYVKNMEEENNERRKEIDRENMFSQQVTAQFAKIADPDYAYVTMAEKLDFSVDREMIAAFLGLALAASLVLFFMQIWIMIHTGSIKTLLEQGG